MFTKLFKSCTITAILLLLNAQNDSAFAFFSKRNHIQIVGSSTVYPFISTVAEEFGRDEKFRTPVVESTGTGGGFKLFCSGIGYNFPDFASGSRKIELSEVEKCNENGVSKPIEIKLGYDGIVLANSIKGRTFALTKKQIFLAIAEKIPQNLDGSGSLAYNHYKRWSEIDPSLPNIPIKIYGPPPSSGTRDAFVELVMEKACKSLDGFKIAYPDEKIRKKKCQIIRSDAVFIEAGENDNLIVQKLKADNNALGVFGFSFLQENKNVVKSIKIDAVTPSFDSIISGEYSVSRPLFIYFKREHIDLVPNTRQFIKEIVSKNTIGKDGYLLQKGLIPLTDLETNQVRSDVLSKL
jgi:phosphate transport system substrate-binding protein